MSDPSPASWTASGSSPNMSLRPPASSHSTPPPSKAQLLPSLIMPDTPPASPVFKTLRPGNAFAQWGSSPPSSPTLSQDAWSSDVESDAGMSDSEVAGNGFKRALHGGAEGEIPDGLRTPKGHPLKGHKRYGSKAGLGLGLGLGFARLGLNLGGPNEEILTEEEEKFQTREKRSGSVHERSPFFVAPKQAWKLPKIRVAKRSRPALYAVIGLTCLIVYLVNHLRASSGTRPLSSLPHRRHVYPINSDDDIILGAGAHNRPMPAHRRKAAPTHSISPSSRAANFKWAGKDMELAGLLSFMTASDANTIPDRDSEASLDPYLVLDFDPASPRVAKDLKDMRTALWRDHPVILLSRTRNAHSRFIKSTLAELYIHPAPVIMDIDQRSDADILDPLFQRLMSQSELPILIVGGQVVGGWAEVDNLTKMNALKPLITSHGGFFVPPKKKKKKSGHGGKSDEQLKKELEDAKKADELKRREQAIEREELRLKQMAELEKEVVPVEDLSDPENF